MGGGGWSGVGNPGEFDILTRARFKFPTPGHLENFKFPPLGTTFCPKQVVVAMSNSRPHGRQTLNVKMPTQGKARRVNFPWVAHPPPPPWGLTLIGALSPVREKSACDLLNWYQMVRLMITWLYIVNDDSGKVEINPTLVRLLPLCLLVLFSFRVFQRSHYRTITTLPLVIYRL